MAAERGGRGYADLLVSVVIVAHNAQKHIATCLESVDRLADEIILHDTGSTDRTVFIASRYGVGVFREPWTGDLAHHRNRALAQAAGRHRLVMEAHEEVVYTDVDETRFRLANDDLPPLLTVRKVQVYRGGRQETIVLPRFIRRGSGMRYAGPSDEHNEPDDCRAAASNVTLLHHGYASREGLPENDRMAEPSLRRVENDGSLRDWVTLAGREAGNAVMMTVEEWGEREPYGPRNGTEVPNGAQEMTAGGGACPFRGKGHL